MLGSVTAFAAGLAASCFMNYGPEEPQSIDYTCDAGEESATLNFDR
jgi:hypothetical protein